MSVLRIVAIVVLVVLVVLGTTAYYLLGTYEPTPGGAVRSVLDRNGW
jgi:hypothetical protein